MYEIEFIQRNLNNSKSEREKILFKLSNEVSRYKRNLKGIHFCSFIFIFDLSSYRDSTVVEIL